MFFCFPPLCLQQSIQKKLKHPSGACAFSAFDESHLLLQSNIRIGNCEGPFSEEYIIILGAVIRPFSIIPIFFLEDVVCAIFFAHYPLFQSLAAIHRYEVNSTS